MSQGSWHSPDKHRSKTTSGRESNDDSVHISKSQTPILSGSSQGKQQRPSVKRSAAKNGDIRDAAIRASEDDLWNRMSNRNFDPIIEINQTIEEDRAAFTTFVQQYPDRATENLDADEIYIAINETPVLGSHIEPNQDAARFRRAGFGEDVDGDATPVPSVPASASQPNHMDDSDDEEGGGDDNLQARVHQMFDDETDEMQADVRRTNAHLAQQEARRHLLNEDAANMPPPQGRPARRAQTQANHRQQDDSSPLYGRRDDILDGDNFNALQPLPYASDSEFISEAEEQRLLSDLRRTHQLWSTSFPRTGIFDEETDEIDTTEVLKKIPDTATTAVKLLCGLVSVNATRQMIGDLVDEDAINQTYDDILERREGIVNPNANVDDNDNAAAHWRNTMTQMQNGARFSRKKFFDAADQEIQRMSDLRVKLVHRSRLSLNDKHNVLHMWAEMVNYIFRSKAIFEHACGIMFTDAAMSAQAAAQTFGADKEMYAKQPAARARMYILAGLLRHNLRRGPEPGMLYMQHWINNNSTPTHYWQQYMPLKEWCSKFLSYAHGVDVRNIHNYWVENHQKMLQQLAIEDDITFPVVNEIRGLYSLRNGIFDDWTFRFYTRGTPSYQKLEDTIGENLYTYKYYDDNFPDPQDFDDNTGQFLHEDTAFLPLKPLERHRFDWDNVPQHHWSNRPPIPIIGGTMTTQGFDNPTKRAFLYDCARMRRPIQHDGMQYATILDGRAGAGKSTATAFLQYCMPDERLGIIRATGEIVFGLMTLLNQEGKLTKHACFILDSRGRMDIDQPTFNSMTSGEGVLLPRKHQGAVSIPRFSLPWWIITNALPVTTPEFADPLLRRCHIFRMNSIAQSGSEHVTYRTIMKAMPEFLRQTSHAYHEFQKRKQEMPDTYKKSTNIWDFAEDSEKEWEQDAKENILYGARFVIDRNFIEHTNRPTDKVAISSLVPLFRAYVEEKSGGSMSTGNLFSANENAELAQTLANINGEAGNGGGGGQRRRMGGTAFKNTPDHALYNRIVLSLRMCYRKLNIQRLNRDPTPVVCQMGIRLDMHKDEYAVGIKLTERAVNLYRAYTDAQGSAFGNDNDPQQQTLGRNRTAQRAT